MAKTIPQIIEKLNIADKGSMGVALAESLGNNNVTVGATVATVGDPTYQMDGQRGKVKSINNGYAEVEFPNGIKTELHINLLIPV